MEDKNTWGLCKHCYGIVPAHFDGTTLTKVCAAHGEQSARVDPEDGFYDRVRAMPHNDMVSRVIHTALSVTNRCNLRCPGCYALPDNSADDSIDDIMAVARGAKGFGLGLMGSEPTMRDDLPELIQRLKAELGKPISIYTNGIRLEDEAYLDSLEKAGLIRICLSLHLPSYVGQKAFDTKLRAIGNIKNTKIALDHVAFSLRTVSEMEEALQYILSLDFSLFSSGYVRLRAPAVIGGVRNEPTDMSTMLNAAFAACKKLGYSIKISPFTNHLHAIMLEVQGKHIMLIRWPTVEEMNLEEIQHGPRTALFVPTAGETQILHQGMLTERVRSGGAHPPPPPADCPSYISGVAA